MVRVPGAGTGLVLNPDRGQSAGPAPRRSQRDPRLAAVGAGAALVAAALTASAGGPGDLRWTCSVDPLLCGPPPGRRRPGTEWLGYARVGQGWLGLVLPGSESVATWEAAVATLGVLRQPPLMAAALMQHLGIAALPAHPPQQAEPGHPPASTAYAPGDSGGPGGAHAAGGAGGPDPVRPANQQDPAGRRPAPASLLRPAEGCVVSAVIGRRVLDLGRVVAAPFAADILESLGAKVRRVRPPDPGRVPAPGEDVIDLSGPAGAEELADLVGDADLVLENFRPRGWGAVRAVIVREPRRRIAIRGFGASSPLRNWKMYGFLVEGFFGIGARPCRAGGRADGGAVWDRLCGVIAAAAAIRQLNGEGPAAVVGEISQIGLARMWLAAQQQAGRPDRIEGRLGR